MYESGDHKTIACGEVHVAVDMNLVTLYRSLTLNTICHIIGRNLYTVTKAIGRIYSWDAKHLDIFMPFQKKGDM